MSIPDQPSPQPPQPPRPEALIIPFPRAARAAPAVPRSGDAQLSVRVLSAAASPPEDAQQRLSRALATLDEALAAQREAIARWRASLDVLQGSVQGLGTSLEGCDAHLQRLGERVGTLNAEARHLEAWADGVLSRQNGAEQ